MDELSWLFLFFFQAEDGIRCGTVTGVQTCALPISEANLPTRYGHFRMIAYTSDVDSEQHIALVRGDLAGAPPPLVCVHSHCLTGDVFGATTCDCHEMIA